MDGKYNISDIICSRLIKSHRIKYRIGRLINDKDKHIRRIAAVIVKTFESLLDLISTHVKSISLQKELIAVIIGFDQTFLGLFSEIYLYDISAYDKAEDKRNDGNSHNDKCYLQP